jgi:hypothetical protein
VWCHSWLISKYLCGLWISESCGHLVIYLPLGFTGFSRFTYRSSATGPMKSHDPAFAGVGRHTKRSICVCLGN